MTDRLLGAIRDLEPILRHHAPEAERERRLSAPVVAAMRGAGLYGLFRPRRLGGLEVDPLTAFRVIEEVSRIDSAAGWNLMISTATEPFGAWFSDDGAAEIFSGLDTVLAASFNPPRAAVPVDGGYRLTGRTTFVSGAHHADWIGGLAHVVDDGRPRLGPDGQPVVLLTMLPRRDVEIVDNWNTLGMCGTGSHDVAVRDAFVPETRAVSFVPLVNPTSASHGGPLYRLATWLGTGAVAVPALGIARAAIDGLIELAAQKTPAYTQKTLRDRAVVHVQLARAEAALGSARAYLYGTFADAWAHVVDSGTMTMERKGQLQLAATNAVHAAAEAVDLVHAAVGATGIRCEYAFQRHFRDVHVLTQHGFICASRYESVGRLLLGLDPEWSFFAF